MKTGKVFLVISIYHQLLEQDLNLTTRKKYILKGLSERTLTTQDSSRCGIFKLHNFKYCRFVNEGLMLF